MIFASRNSLNLRLSPLPRPITELQLQHIGLSWSVTVAA